MTLQNQKEIKRKNFKLKKKKLRKITIVARKDKEFKNKRK